ncbi:Hypothetical protein NTJ_12133 [Nesidiocoris tenuis]|uniref:Uncharacterized protein n=1 Tax=Nesidiocoris tenuis TaxID=355587 RepID=A0ABN7B824_9HEMI|nr:Hypothetical protein NTJ_12133 [Nesidiocoris tenuis]
MLAHGRPRTPPPRTQDVRTRRPGTEVGHRIAKCPMTPPYPDVRNERKIEHERRPPSPPTIYETERYNKDDRRRLEQSKIKTSHSSHHRQDHEMMRYMAHHQEKFLMLKKY